MPEQRFTNVSQRRCTGIMGTNTRQRTALDWTPLSLHFIGEDPKGLFRISAPPPSPDKTGGRTLRSRLHLSVEWDGMRERTCF